ncbi:hypothetical protein HHL19_35310 [Streptomyces sp. R302]|uniref:hypothetical protein n=1 Tax=unclassified Streptomyces TaxID=2593676 RepID=UPI00145ECE0E|nr:MULTISPECIES: hypothetical protein [unclassified Streptomyces]NML55189.1 hypothetical protein [Streptomyces sp. R301]NML83781.1 hypothetical protein [Streptomyces sp. R302]
MSATLNSITAGAQVGALLPLITAVIQRRTWSASRKKAVAVAFSVLTGLVTVASEGGWAQFQNGKLTTVTVLSVVVAAQAAYSLIWKPTRVAPAIETITSPKAPQQAG